MDQNKTGALIRARRQEKGMTQGKLAGQLAVSDKTVSKWERGCGAPDISLLPPLAEALGVSARSLLRGELDENTPATGNMKRSTLYRCPLCGNLLFSTDGAELYCCGQKLAPLTARKPDSAHTPTVECSDGEWLVTVPHEMRREHYISFFAFLTGDTLLVKRLYPEWDAPTRLPFFAHDTLLRHCMEHGLFTQEI